MSDCEFFMEHPEREGEAPAEPPLPRTFLERKRPPHGVLISPSRPTIVVLTICTRNRERWLATDDIQDLLESIWSEALAWLAGKYVLMADHMHLFAGLADAGVTLERWAQYWKSMFTKRHRVTGHRWQPHHWDTRLRSAADYAKRWEYVRLNPVRQGLVARAEDWPFQGEIHRLSWDEGL